MKQQYIVWFEEIDKDDIPLVGGKGANLGEMLQAGFPVPYGFILTSHAYFSVLEENNLVEPIRHSLAYVNVEHPSELQTIARHIQNLILRAHIPNHILTSIGEYYHDLSAKEIALYKHTKRNALVEKVKSFYGLPYVAVRSSATAEDLPQASFAGQQETFLNIKGENHLVHKIRECWASLFTERAIYYREHNKFDHTSVGLAAVVQRMIESEASGIGFSIDPVTDNKKVMTIEAIWGLGEYIVQGKVTPDHYEIEKGTHKILKKTIAKQNLALIRKAGVNHDWHISSSKQDEQKIPDEAITTLAGILEKIEKHYYFPQDIEWAYEKGNIYIVQARPITTIKKDGQQPEAEGHGSLQDKVLVIGSPASPGVGSGRPVILASPNELDKIKKGDVLVAQQTNPDYVPAMKKASAIVTERGGRTSHAAIVSRELGIPAVVGAENAIKILEHEKIVSVHGTSGTVYRGNILFHHVEKKYKDTKTRTKVYVNLAEPEKAEEVAAKHVDGVGLLRAEFMIADIGIHPKEIIREQKQKEFTDILAKRLETFAKAFYPRPVIYRATDFKTNEYRHLKGGKLYEPEEENPMLGYRGAARYIGDPLAFKLEIDAIKKVRARHMTNLHLMIPFVRSVDELQAIKNMLDRDGITKDKSFKLWIMVEIPSTALCLQDYINVGIDGVSIGTNDLTMLTLGVDRDNASVSQLYTEKNPAVLYLLKTIVSTAKKNGITCSICGQAASDYPEIIEALVKEGVTSVSVNIDAIERSRELISQIEAKLG